MTALPGLRAVSTPMAARPVLQATGGDQTGWNIANKGTMDDVGSERGPVPGRAVDGGAGAGNFQLSTPAVLLGGRGIDLNLFFNYNSRVWHRAGSEITFDIDRDMLVPGWNLGFGKIIMAGDTYFVMDSDGTRHPFEGTFHTNFPAPATSLQTFEGRTTDGSFIDYYAEGYKFEFDNSGGRNMIVAWAVLPDGTRIEYGASANYAMYPTRVTDAHGNFITITYLNNEGPKIQTITDTLGRVVYFHYDGSGLLTSIVVPALNGGSRVAVRLQYQWLTLSNTGANYGFASGLATKVRQNTIPVVRAIYYPGTATGYWFGAGDSYSPYGMIRKVSEHRGMTFDNAPLDQQGNIGPGVMSREMVYNYPQSGGSYSDMPTYTQMTEDWAGRTTASAPVTHFLVENVGSTRRTTITRPDGAQVKQSANNDPSSATYGVLLGTSLYSQGGVFQRLVENEWVIGAYHSPRSVKTTTFDVSVFGPGMLMTVTTYSYDQAYGSRYNAPSDVRVYGYGGELLRRSHAEYLNNSNYNGSLQNSGTVWWKGPGSLYGGPYWQGSHIFNLVTLTDVYAGDDVTRLSRTEYQYDGGGLINNPGMLQHNITYNQHAPEYDPATAYRANVTQIKQYADALSLDQDTAVVVTRTSDIAGNLRAQSFSCCEQTTITYTTNTQYAWPDSQTSGSPSDQSKQNTSSATYDYNTGLVLTSTDANDRDTVIDYDPSTLRPVRENLSTGAYQLHIYDDLNLSVSDFVYEAGQSGDNFASRSDTYLDGLGRAIKEVTFVENLTQGIVRVMVETKFDNLGRVSQQSRPYRADGTLLPIETVLWSTVTYDSLDRRVQTISPDGSVVTRAYNQIPNPPGASGQLGKTVKVTDPWGRERWARGDALGRIVEVAEPNPEGSGALSGGAMYTTYSYDVLGRLLQVDQGAQTRRFRYDSLGRLTHQKLAERDATLDNGGQWVGSGQWSDVFTYDKRSNVTQRVDSRGVKTIFKYKDTGGNEDPLNRLLAVEYDKSGSPQHLRDNIPDAPDVSYGYMTTTPGDKMRAANIAVSSGMGNEQLSYDSEGRLSQVHRTFAGREGYPVVTNYIWDSLHRLKENAYPQQYGAGEIRKIVEPAYDAASRLESLKFGGVNFASNPEYNSASQMTSLDVGSQIKEIYNYDPENGLMTQQQVKRGAELLVDLKYNYTINDDANNLGPKTGQLTGITDLKNTGRNRAYEYDKLGRLIKVKGGVHADANPTWYQTYSYDRYGNRSLVQHMQLAMAPVNPSSQSRSDLIGKVGQGAGDAANRIFSADKPLATLGINESYGSIIAGDDSVGTRVKGGPRVTEEEYRVKSRDVTEAGTGAISGSETEEEYRVKSGDAAGNLAASDDSTFTTPDTTPLVISNVAATNITSTSAWITWSTDELSQGRVEYGLTTAYGQWSPSTTFIDFGGAVNLTGLTPGTTYHYRAWAWGWEGGSAVSGDFTFTTPDATPPVISNVAAGGIASSKATITWTTNENSNSQVEYGLTQAYGQSTPEYPALVTAHSLELSGLTPNTLYHYRVKSRDAASNLAISDDFTFITAQSAQIPLDGLANLSYNGANNRITTSGFEYDPAGNQTRAVIDASGTQQQYRYDCAGRLAQVLDAGGNVLAIYSYGASNQRLMSVEGGVTRYFTWDGGKIIAEFEASGANALVWKTSYVYLGGQLLATTSGAAGTETRFHHPDRLGTRLVTDAAGTVVSEQLSMPFGNMLPFTQAYGGENSYQHPTLSNPSKKRFTSYDRSEATRLDYAVNRFYSPQQGRFTQADPIGMGAVELASPQSLNLYAYVENDPINSSDPLGLDGTIVFRPFPTPPGSGAGGGGLNIGPVSFSFSFGGGSFLNFGSLQQSKGKQQTGISKGGGKVGDLGIIVISSEPPDIGVKVGGEGGVLGAINASDDELLDALQHTLDYVGLVPGYGEAADFISGWISLKRGDYAGFSLSMAAMIPGIGILSGVAKIARRIAARMKAARMAAKAAGQSSIVLGFTRRNLQKGFTKHGADFGLMGNWNPSRAAEFSAAVNQHINSAGVRAISGSYRGVPGYTHYLNPQTGLNVVADSVGNYVTGFRLGANQLNDVLTKGNLW